MKMFSIALTCGAIGLSGCASSLKVWDATTEIKGVPFRAAEMYIARGVYTRHSEFGEDCTKTPFEKTLSLPTGAQYFANVAPAPLAKTAFGMEFADSGALAGITMNTEPAAADTVNAVTTALSTLLPFAGVAPKSAPAEAFVEGGAQSPSPACDTGPVGVTYVRFDDRG